jgi:hypothetical protein
MESVSLYSEARNEYIKQLATWIVPPLVEFFRKEYTTIGSQAGRRVMTAFQTWCSEIPKWNQDVIDTNVGVLLDSCRCDYVEELMTAVFIAHTKMLTAIRVSTKQKKLQITLPKLDHFLHRVFVECARSFWKAPFLFSDELSPIEQQKNILHLESMCTEALSSAVRSLLPVKSILRDYLEDEEEEIPVKAKKSRKEESDSEEDIPVKTKKTGKEESDSEEEIVKPVISSEESTKEIKEVEEEFVPLEGGDRHSVPYVEQTAPVEVPKPILVEKDPCLMEELKMEFPSEPVKADELFVSELIPEPVLESVPEQVPESVPEPIQRDEQIEIDTTPSVRFSDYETVFSENSNTNEIRYAPKMSVEDMDWGPRLEISEVSEGLDEIDIEDLEPAKPVEMKPVSDDDDEVLNAAEFEELS